MAPQGQPVDVIDAIFGSPFLKGAMAALGAFTAIARYIKESGERYARAATIGTRYGLRGPAYFLINRLPHAIHRIVAISVLVIAFLEICVLVDQYSFDRALISSMPPRVQVALDLFSRGFVGLVLGALCFWAMFEFRVIERFMAWALGLVPSVRTSLGWVNAQWQISASEKDRRVLVPAQTEVDAAASRLIDALTAAPRNESLALRPARLSANNAANVLYFGHVIEQYLAATGVSLPWTKFYEALTEVAEGEGAPFSPEGVCKLAQAESFFAILLQANTYLDAAKIPNDVGLEHAVESARAILRDRYRSDARKIASGFLRTTYTRTLRKSRTFLTRESMRRQFAKLFILWNIAPSGSRPEVFRIPFNTRMFMRYLDAGILRSDGDHFDFTSESVDICFEAVQKQILSRVLVLLNETKDPARSKWRETEKTDVESRNLDWRWWIYYRADQQAYHDARGYASSNWKVEGNEVVSK